MWMQLGIKETNQTFWRSNLQQWLDMNGRVSNNYVPGKPLWKMLFPFAIWVLWKSRNHAVFSRKAQNVNLADEIVNQTFEFIHCMHSPRSPVRMMVKSIRWEKPQEGWMKLNTDESFTGNLGLVGYGGILRDNHGK